MSHEANRIAGLIGNRGISPGGGECWGGLRSQPRFVSERKAENITQSAPWKRSERQRKAAKGSERQRKAEKGRERQRTAENGRERQRKRKDTAAAHSRDIPELAAVCEVEPRCEMLVEGHVRPSRRQGQNRHLELLQVLQRNAAAALSCGNLPRGFGA